MTVAKLISRIRDGGSGRYLVASLGILFALIDIFIKPVSAVALGFVALAVIPWLAPLIKALTLPGGTKIEFNELQKIELEAERAGLTKSGAQYLAGSSAPPIEDPNLALAALRIEIERRIRKLAEVANITSVPMPLGAICRWLYERDVLSQTEYSVLTDLLPTLNRAVHGAEVTERASNWAMEFGPRIVAALEDKVQTYSSPPKSGSPPFREGSPKKKSDASADR